MQDHRFPLMLAVLGVFLLLPQMSLAARHLWHISEIFSNSDGSVQFIEILTETGGQNLLSAQMIVADSDGVQTSFIIPSNTPDSNTANQRVLFATSGFGALPGAVTPDFTLGSGPFFDQSADNLTISFTNPAGSPFDSWTFSGNDLPDNGVDSLNEDMSTGPNSPTNYAGQIGHVELEGAPDADPACTPTPTSLCLNNNRFRVDVDWRSFNTPGSPVDFAASGMGRNTPVSDVWTGFWFFDPDNLDLLVHIFEGCSFDNNFWVFAAGLTNVEVTLTITDTQTNQVRSYESELGTPFEPIQDTSAFATCPKSYHHDPPEPPDPDMPEPPGENLPGAPGEQTQGTCSENSTTVCLLDGRFQVSVDTPSFSSPAQELADGTVGFPFTNPTFFDLFVSITDASSANGQYWVTYSMFDPSDFTLTVVDTFLNQTQVYNHNSNDPIFVQDQMAFPGDEVIALDGSLSGSWFAPTRDGEGFIFDIAEVNGIPNLVLYYFTYENNNSGRQAWVVGLAPIIGNKASVPVIIAEGTQFGADFNTADITRTDWGNVKVTFLSCDRVLVESDSTLFPSVRYEAIRLTPAPTGVQGSCQAAAKALPPATDTAGVQIDGGYAGSWFRPDRDGEGFIFNIAEIGGVNTLVVFYFTYEDNSSGRQAWVVGSAPIIGNMADVPMVIDSGAQFGDAFDPADVVQTSWGNVKVTWQSCDSATMEVSSSFGDISFDIIRLTMPTIGATGNCAM